jgi:hypothetical protein
VRDCRRLELSAQAPEEVLGPLWQVEDSRGEPRGMQAEPQDIDGRPEQLWIDAHVELGQGSVGGHDIPVPVDGERWERLVRFQGDVDGKADGLVGRIVHRPIAIDGGEPCRHEPRVALPQRHIELFREPEHQSSAGRGAARFYEAEVPRRDVGPQRQLHLREVAPRAPAPKMLAKSGGDRQRTGAARLCVVWGGATTWARHAGQPRDETKPHQGIAKLPLG